MIRYGLPALLVAVGAARLIGPRQGRFRLANMLVAVAGTIYRRRRVEFKNELTAVQTETDESGLDYAVGVVLGAAVERVIAIGDPLRVRGVTKSFGNTAALRSVSLDIEAGTVTALLGGNGSGKSTLLKLISGAETADEGSIRFGNTSVTANRGRMRVAVVDSHPQLFDRLTIAQNMVIGYPQRTQWLVDTKRDEDRAKSTLRHLGSSLDPSQLVGSLALPDRIIVAIGRAVQRGCQLIVLNELTGSLSHDGAERVTRCVRTLRDDGYSIVYVSYQIDEVFALADRLAVLRDGELVFDGPIESTDPDEVVHQIVGDRTDPAEWAPPATPPAVVDDADAVTRNCQPDFVAS